MFQVAGKPLAIKSVTAKEMEGEELVLHPVERHMFGVNSNQRIFILSDGEKVVNKVIDNYAREDIPVHPMELKRIQTFLTGGTPMG